MVFHKSSMAVLLALITSQTAWTKPTSTGGLRGPTSRSGNSPLGHSQEIADGVSISPGAQTRMFFFDDFEAYTEGSEPGNDWLPVTSLGNVTVDDSKSYSGSRSVKFDVQSSTGYKKASIQLKSVFPAPGNVFHGRAMFFLESAPTSDVHWTFVQASGLVNGDYHASFRYGGQRAVAPEGSSTKGSQLMANYDTPDYYGGKGPGTDCWKQADGVVMPVTGAGEECVHQEGSYPWSSPAFDMLDIGWESYNPDDSPRTLWIDDIVVSNMRIGCPPPSQA